MRAKPLFKRKSHYFFAQIALFLLPIVLFDLPDRKTLTGQVLVCLSRFWARIATVSEQILYANPRFEEVLNSDPNFSPNTYVGDDLYLYTIQQCFDSPGDVFSLHVALSQFLERNNFQVQPTEKYRKLYNLILSAQPKWLDVDPTYVQREIMSASDNVSDKEFKQWLHAEFLKRFVYVTKPPRWIQNPQWPIGENGPLIFLGQVQVKNYFHDDAAVYVFHDQKSGLFETIRQTY